MIYAILLYLLIFNILSGMDNQITIIGNDGDSFEESYDIVKKFLKIPFTISYNEDEGENSIDFRNDSNLKALTAAETLKRYCNYLKELKEKGLTVNEKTKNDVQYIRQNLNDYLKLGDYFGIKKSYLKYLSFLLFRFSKLKEDHELVRALDYRFSYEELLKKNLIKKSDLLKPCDGEGSDADSFPKIKADLPMKFLFELLPHLRFIEQKRPLMNEGNFCSTFFPRSYRFPHTELYDLCIRYGIFYYKKIISERLAINLSKLGIENRYDLKKFIQQLENHPSTILNLSGLNLTQWDMYELFLDLRPDLYEERRIFQIKLNRNQIKYFGRYYLFKNLKKISAKYNKMESMCIQVDTRSSKDIANLKNVEVNLAHNNVTKLPCLKEYIRPDTDDNVVKKYAASFKKLNLKNNPLSGKARLRIHNGVVGAYYLERIIGYGIVSALYCYSPLIHLSMLYTLYQCRHICFDQEKRSRFFTKYSQLSTWLNPPFLIFTPLPIFFISRYLHHFYYFIFGFTNKKISYPIMYDRKNIFYESFENIWTLFKESLHYAHRYTNCIDRRVIPWYLLRKYCPTMYE